METDLKESALTFRVLYVGPPGATKFLNLRGLRTASRESERGRLEVFAMDGDRVLAYSIEPRGAPMPSGQRARFIAMAVPGRCRNPAAERLLLRAADAVIFLPSRSNPTGTATRSAFTTLCAELEQCGRHDQVSIVVQDYDDARPRLDRHALLGATRGPELIFVPVSGDTLETVVKVFEVARDAVLHRFRRRTPGEPGPFLREALPDPQRSRHPVPAPAWVPIVGAGLIAALLIFAWWFAAQA